uniref:Uncharacterized protein n=1 Tax=Timema tahoe TaxID=61484 RepID=A0A7R9FHY2_9NEOP|nr:unnamed protein product [Timema tahoe]
MQALAYTWLLIIMMCSTPTSLKAAVNNEDSGEEKHKVAEILPTLFKLVHCPEERSVVVNSEARNSSVAWPQVISSSAKSSKRVASDPLCISPEGDIITRFCVKKNTLNNPIWDPLKPPECFRSQPSYDNVHKCPLPYKDFSIHGRHFCVLMTEPREWAPACESGVTDEDILELSMSEFTSLVDYFRRMGVTSVWLPVKRFGNYGPLLRRLPGEEYGDKFKMPDHLLLSWSPNQQPLRGECLKLNIPFDINSAVTLGTDDCNHKYPVACVYKPSSDMLVRLACPEHYFTSRYSNEQDRCLSVSKNNIPGSWEEANLKCFEKGGHLMKISSVQDNYLAEEIINDFDCKDGWIGARRKSSDKGYEWDLGINNSVEVGFVNWDPKLSFGEIVDGRGALNEHGFWALYNRTYKLKCSICETKIEIPRTELSLRHDPEANRLTLSVYSPKGLWKESEKEEEGCTSSITMDGSKFLHWEFTKFGITSVPNELCLDQYGIPVHRRCSGSFLTGGMWEEPIGSCNDTMISFSTHALHSLAMGSETLGDVSTSNIAQGISKLSVNYSNLIPADVYYLALVMKNLARLSNESQTSTDDMFELEALTNIIDYVNEADRETVALSQMYLNSTNILLDALNELLNLICMNANITKNNGVILSVTSQVIVQISDPSLANITGLALARKKHSNYVSTEKYKSFKDYDIVPLKSDQTLEPIMQSDEIEVATWIPNELLTEITNENFNFSSFYDPEINETVTIEPSYLLKGRKPYIVIVVLYKDVLFYEASRVRSQRRTIATNQSREANSDDDQDEVNIVGSRVISVSIPGIGSDLPVPIPIVFKPLLSSLNKPSNQRTCAFWDFSFNSSTPSQSLGGWSGDGCVYAGHSLQGNEKGKNGLEVCVCTHLTHFAELILGPSAYRTLDKSKISDPNIQYLLINEKALDIISIVGCTISLFGVIGIVTTAAVFRSWRDKSGTKILLQLSLAIALQMVGYLLSNFNTRNKHTAIPIPEEEVSNYENNEIVSCPEGSKIAGDLMNYSYDDITICDPYLIDGEENIFCIILAAFNHYAILCGFSWMLVTAFLQFQRYVKVLGCTRPPRFLLKSTLFGWGIPLIPVCVMLMITPYSYVPSYHTTMCHLTGKSLYLGVILPASMFIFVNLFVFVKVIDSVLRGPDGKVRSNPDRNLVYSQLRLGVVLFFLLGLSWVFGIILSLNPNTIIFSYLFCLTATTQGFVMFLFFVVCDPSTRHLWIKLVSTWGKIACGLTFNTGEKLSNSNVSDSFRNIDCPKKEATKKQELSYENPVTDQTPVNDKKNSVQQNYSTDKKGWNDAKY